MKIKMINTLLMIFAIISMVSCDDTDPIIFGNNLYFKAINLSVDSDRTEGAKSYGVIVSTTVTISYTYKGETVSQSVSSKSNELLVRPGNELEITFYPSCQEESEAIISLPDGTTRKVTTQNPTFKWTVPADISKEMEITGESHYKRKGDECHERGRIILTPLI